MNSPEDDNLSFDNEKDEFHEEKLDFEENELITEENFDELYRKNNSIDASVVNCSSGEEGLIEDDEKQDQTKQNDKQTIFKLTNVIKNGEDGELNDDSDEDLEEGELKDEDDNNPINQSLDQIIKNEHQKKVLCKFYTNGLCSWGDQCRFLHSGKINPQPSINHNYKAQSINHQPQQYARTYQKSHQFKHYDNQSDPDYDSYERKRRLAFISLESAPWNNDLNYTDQRNNRLIDDRRRDDLADYKNQSNSSFSDFSSEKSFKQQHPQHSPVSSNSTNRKRKLSGQLSSSNVNKDHYSKREWNDDSSPASSFFSDSADEFDKYDKPKSPSYSSKRKRSRSRERYSRDSSKDNLRTNLRENPKKLDQYSSPKMRSKLHTSHRRPIEKEEKKPIKMTFMKKNLNLNKGNEFSSEEEEDENGDDNFEMYGSKDLNVKTSKIKSSDEQTIRTTSGGTSREELLKRLKEIDEAIAKKRSRT